MTIKTSRDIRYKTIETNATSPWLVLVMGYAGSLDAWPKKFLDDLSTHYNVVIFDNRGTGLSLKPDDLDSYTIPLMAGDLNSVIEELSLNDFFLLGWSLGGCIALQYANLFPEKVKKMILMSTIGGRSLYTTPNKSVLEKLASPEGESIWEMFLDGWSTCISKECLKKFEDELRAIYQAIEPHFTSPTACEGHLKAYKEFEASDWLSSLTMPIKVVTGSDDRLTPAMNSIKLAKAIGQDDAITISNCEHMPHIEQRDALMKIITGFFG